MVSTRSSGSRVVLEGHAMADTVVEAPVIDLLARRCIVGVSPSDRANLDRRKTVPR